MSSSSRRPVVLLVEPEGELRQVLLELLDLEGFEAVGAETAETGRTTCLESPPSVVLLRHPMTGSEDFLRWLRSRAEPLRSTPVVLLTIFDPDEEEVVALEPIGFEAVRTIPCESADLVRLVRRLGSRPSRG